MNKKECEEAIENAIRAFGIENWVLVAKDPDSDNLIGSSVGDSTWIVGAIECLKARMLHDPEWLATEE